MLSRAELLLINFLDAKVRLFFEKCKQKSNYFLNDCEIQGKIFFGGIFRNKRIPETFVLVEL